jgi:hypothetical protein
LVDLDCGNQQGGIVRPLIVDLKVDHDLVSALCGLPEYAESRDDFTRFV